MKRFFTLCSILLTISITTMLQAIPAKPGIQTIEQPDGTTLRITLHGDEHFHFTTTEDGYLIKQNANGVYEYAEFTTEKGIKSIGVKAYSKEQRVRNKQLPNRAVKAAEAFKSRKVIKNKRINAQAATIAPKGLVLLVQFSDKSFKAASTHSSMNEMLNGTNYTYSGATGSVKKYFTDQSNGKYLPDFGVFGPITLSRNMAYYGQNVGENDIRPHEMVNEACSIANANFNVDFSQYDSDNDGNVDFVYVIYAGYAEAQGGGENTIWPHQWDLRAEEANIPASKRKYDGKYVARYACSSELQGASGSTRDGIGTFCHEFSHVLGLPDYYDTEYGTNYNSNATPNSWSLMDAGSYNNNGKTPPNYSAYDKYYIGWITPTVLNAPDNVTLQADGENYYAITADGKLSTAKTTKEVWYLENRQQTGWDAYLPAHGMLVTKVQYNNNAWEENTVNNGTPMYYDIIEADGKASGSSSTGATFPGSRNITSFIPVNTYPLTEITETSGVIKFKFMGDRGSNNDDTAESEVLFYDSFETEEEWIITDNSTTAEFNMEIGGLRDIDAVSGEYYLISGYDADAQRNAWAIMRNGIQLKAGQEYTIEAYLYAPGYGEPDQIQITVGKSSDNASQTKVILDLQEIYDDWTVVSAKFTPITDDAYHFGIHHCTKILDVNAIAIDEFTIKKQTNTTNELENVKAKNENVQKIIQNGNIYIVRDNKKYTIEGRLVK